MADVVQYKLERMANELDDLERRGLFSRREIAEIVKQRRKFEYRLKRPSPLKQDFLAYIDYEKQLDSLRRLRTKAVARELKKKGNRKLKKSVSDFAGVSRIIEIYRLATNRFKGDIQLWFQYLEFCRERRNGRVKKALAQVIRFHPKVPGVWIYAAAWEFDHNLNAAAARALMQSGLRACPTSEDLWVEYLRMELTYLNKLKARKVALGEDEGTMIRDSRDTEEKQWREENRELFMALDDNRENRKESDIRNGESEKVDMFQEQGLNIIRTVYSGAIEALPSSFSLRTRFLEILEVTNLTHYEEMRKEMLADMKRDFLQVPEYWDWFARHETVGLSKQENGKNISPDQLGKAVEVYEEALKIVPSSLMFNFYIKFLMYASGQQNQETQNSGPYLLPGCTIDPREHALKIFEKAENMGCITEDLACQHVSFLLQLGKIDEARKVAEGLCNGKLLDAIQLWVLRLSIEIKFARNRSSSSKADPSAVFEHLRNIVTKVAVSDAESLWALALKFFSDQKHFRKLIELSLVLLAKDGGSDNGFSLSSAIVNSIVQREGIQKAREIYQRFLALPHPGLALYRNCIDMELNLASAGDKDCLQNARKLYEQALATYDQDLRLWQDYYSMEIKMGTSETAASVHWRARKTLKDNFALSSNL